MKSLVTLLMGLAASQLMPQPTAAGDHVYFHHTHPTHVYSPAPVYYSPGYYAPAAPYQYAPYAYVATSAYPPGPVIQHCPYAAPVAPSAAWSCCPPKYRRLWHDHDYYGHPGPVQVDYKYGLFGKVKGVTVRY